jgi:U32 family peptidase
MKIKQIEIMSPAGSWESLRAALKAGANSVYFGIEGLNMRSRGAKNFQIEELPKIVKLCNEYNCKSYLTVNTILYNHDLNRMREIVDAAKKSKMTAIIASDISAIQYAHSINMEVHISTQCNVSNIEAVRFYAQFSDVIVLARELTLAQIVDICEAIETEQIKGTSGKLLEIEIFAHGALCVAISGKCYMSLAQQNSSANRGACMQMCRRSYRVTEEETGNEFVVDNNYIMSPKDLCTIEFLDKILDAGVSVLKLEGRGRSPDYVHTVTKTYREAADAYLEGTYTKEKAKKWKTELEKVFNRGFWEGGYYLGKKLGEWSGTYGSQAKTQKIFLGRASKFFVKPSVAEFLIETGELNEGDEIMVTGPTTGYLKQIVENLHVDGKPTKHAKKKDIISIKFPERVRKNDQLFLIKNK